MRSLFGLIGFSCLGSLLSLGQTPEKGWIIQVNSLVQQEATVDRVLLPEGVGLLNQPFPSHQFFYSASAVDTQWISSLRESGAEVIIEPDEKCSLLSQPNDSLFGLQWALAQNGQVNGRIGVDIAAPQAWEFTTGNKQEVVGIVDTGIDWDHPDLIDNIWQNLAEDADQDGKVLEWNGQQWIFDPGDINGIDDDGNGYVDDFIGWDFVENDNDPTDEHIFGHGTHVAGIIGASANNGIGITGIAQEVSLMALRILDDKGAGRYSDAIAALHYATSHGVRLSNHSWGAPVYSQILDQAIQAQPNHLLVAAAGNNFGNDNDQQPIYPASFQTPNVIAVCATNSFDQIASFSNVGRTSIDVGAPGEGILSTSLDGQYSYMSGTSMAAPMVTGGLVLYFSLYGSNTVGKAKETLLQSVDPLSLLQGKCLSSGRLNLLRLLENSVFFQREVPGLAEGILPIGGGKWLLYGENNSDAWVRCYGRKGTLQWEKVFGQVQDIQILPVGDTTFWVMGNLPSGQDILRVSLNSLGQHTSPQKWSLNTQSWKCLESLATEQGYYVAGWVEQASDTSIWLVHLDSSLSLKWGKSYLTRPHKPIRVQLAAGEGSVYVQATYPNEKPNFLQIDKQTGQLNQGYELAIPSSTQLEALALWEGEEKDINWIARYTHSNGEGRLGAWQGEEDENWESTWQLSLGAIGDKGIAVKRGTRGETLVWTSVRASNQAYNGFITLDEEGILAQQSYRWPAETIPVGIAPNARGVIGLLSQLDSTAVWINTDKVGRSFCNLATPQVATVSAPAISVSTLTSQSSPFSFVTAGYVPFSGLPLGGDSVYCDNSQCTVKSYFELDRLTFCEEELLRPRNKASHATSYQWLIDGIPVSTGFEPNLLLPEDEGLHRLTLEAINGNCIDTFGLTLQVEQEPEFAPLDTSKCGPLIQLKTPIQSSIFSYRWSDSLGNTLSTNETVLIRNSGTYQLVVSDICTNSHAETFHVQLVPGCVWPGDANADGFVNMIDYLVMGGINGEQGPSRVNANPTYTPQLATDWMYIHANTHDYAPEINAVHSDADGDGMVNVEADGAIVKRNFSGDPFASANAGNEVELALLVEQEVVSLEDTIRFSVSLQGRGGAIVDSSYGLAITLAYNLPLTQPISISPADSWIGNIGELDTLIVQDYVQKRLHVGLSRTNRLNQNGRGIALDGGITVLVDEIGGPSALTKPSFLTLSITEAALVDQSGQVIPINGLTNLGSQTIRLQPPRDSLMVSAELVTPVAASSLYVLAPNPTQSHINVYPTQPSTSPITLSVLNMYGQTVKERVIPYRPVLSLDVSTLPNGLYWLQYQVDNQSHTKSFLILK